MHPAHLLKRSLVAALLCGVSVTAAAYRYDPLEVQGLHGDVSFSGAVIAAPCRISMDSLEQTIDLGVLPNSLFHNVGDRSQPIPFRIRLQDCLRNHVVADQNRLTIASSNEGYLVKVAFYGEGASKRAPNLLGGHGLTGIGLRLMDTDEHPLMLGRESDPIPLHFDNDTLSLKVSLESYDSQDHIKLGNFYSQVTFRLSYL